MSALNGGAARLKTSWPRIRAIARKDIREALRDSRIAVTLLTPVVLGLVYSVAVPNETPKPNAKIGYVAAGQTQLPQAIKTTAGTTVKLSFVTYAGADALRLAVRDKKVDIGLLVPAGFDAAVAGGSSPTLTSLLPESTSFGGDYIAATLDKVVLTMSGHGPPAVLTRVTVPPKSLTSQGIIERLGLRKYFILTMVVFLLAMIAVYAVPIALTDEVEKKTLDALLLIASPGEVTISKALFGIAYGVVGVPILMAITRITPHDWPLFMAGIALSAAALVAIGLVFAVLLKNPNQTNTWGTLVLTPLVVPAFIGAATLPGWADALLQVLPSTHTMRLATNALSGQTLYQHAWLSWLVLAAWAVAGYAVVAWRLRTREA